MYGVGDRLCFIDPADGRRRVNGTVVEVWEGRGPIGILAVLDDQPGDRMEFGLEEITGYVR